VRSIRTGVSGGTVDSLRQQVLQIIDDPTLRALVSDPRCLVDGDLTAPAAERAEPPKRKGLRIRRDDRTGVWQTPFVMGGFNRQIVLRSSSINDGARGANLHYREVVDTGRGPRGVVKAGVIAAGSSAVMVGMALGPSRWLLDRILPDPGDGPSEKARQRGHFLIDVEADTTGGGRYVTRIAADVEPAYDGSSVMLGESALCLALDDLPNRFGVLTPMTAMGESLADRLRQASFTVTTERLDR
jgi:short subunit dehydrogenase-like uncharacterized protein